MSKQSRLILSAFFSKLTRKDFESDKFLYGFYLSYLDEIKENNTITIFEYYVDYVLRNKKYDASQKNKERDALCDEIQKEIFAPETTNATTETTNATTQLNAQPNTKPITTTKPKKQIKIKGLKLNKKIGSVKKKVITTKKGKTSLYTLNKKKCLKVISNFIKSSLMIVYEDPTETFTEDDESFMRNATNTIIEEIKEDGREIVAVRDKDFNIKSKMLSLYKNIELQLEDIIKNNVLARTLKKTYFIDGKDIVLGSNQYITTITDNGEAEQHNDLLAKLPQEKVLPKWTGQTYSTKVLCIHANPLTEIINISKKSIKSAYLLAGNQIIPGGGSDQGIFTHESYLYYSSSYYLCVEQTVSGYPLTTTQVIACPNILVIRDHKNKNFPPLQALETEKIRVLTSTPPYRPAVNLDNLDKYRMDLRLYHAGTRYKNPEEILQHLRCTFNAALFFGMENIVIDDRGVDDFWLPAHHTALLLSNVINEYRGKFNTIIVAVEHKHNHDIFKNYIT